MANQETRCQGKENGAKDVSLITITNRANTLVEAAWRDSQSWSSTRPVFSSSSRPQEGSMIDKINSRLA